MADVFQNYLALLASIRSNLEQLTALSRQTSAAVQNDDLLALDEVMKQEQALTLAFRGVEQSREKMLKEMGLMDVPLSELSAHYPPELRAQAAEAVQALQAQYAAYRQCADEARGLLESNLQQVEGIITSMGGPPVDDGPGYASPEIEPPRAMKTDFRA